MVKGWTKEWPKKEGDYWCYSISEFGVRNKLKPALSLVKVRKISNGLMYTAHGQFFYKSEIAEAWFMKAELPDTKGLIKE